MPFHHVLCCSKNRGLWLFLMVFWVFFLYFRVFGSCWLRLWKPGITTIAWIQEHQFLACQHLRFGGCMDVWMVLDGGCGPILYEYVQGIVNYTNQDMTHCIVSRWKGPCKKKSDKSASERNAPWNGSFRCGCWKSTREFPDNEKIATILHWCDTANWEIFTSMLLNINLSTLYSWHVAKPGQKTNEASTYHGPKRSLTSLLWRVPLSLVPSFLLAALA